MGIHKENTHMSSNISKPCGDETESKLRAAMATIHAILSDTLVKGAPARDQYALMGNMVASTLTMCDKYRREQALAGLRDGAHALIVPAIEAKRTEKSAFEASLAQVPEAFKAIIRKASPTFDHVDLPLGTFASLFPTGTDNGRIAAAMRDIGYKVVGGSDNLTVRAAVA
jgi:hypothetical protein